MLRPAPGARPPGTTSGNADAHQPFAGLTEKERDLLRAYTSEPTPENEAQAAALLSRPETVHALAIVEQASRRPACVFPIRWERGWDVRFPELRKFRAAAELLAAQAAREARRGQPDEACRWLAVDVRMSAHLSVPALPAQLYRYSVVAIGWRTAERLADSLPRLALDFCLHTRRVALDEQHGRREQQQPR